MDNVTVSQIVQRLHPTDCIGDKNAIIKTVKSIDNPDFDNHSIGWCSDKNAHLLANVTSGTVIISEKLSQLITKIPTLNYIITPTPRLFFSNVIVHFFVEKTIYGVICPSAIIDSAVSYDKQTVNIGSNVVIEKGVTIGKNVIIHHNTVIKSNTQIGNNVTIGSNCTIGSVGFGYEKNEFNDYELIPHIGNVVIKDHVEIGNNVCIDRAVLESTVLHNNVKIDNLVHIAHGVQVGANSLIIANAMVAGSVTIGENTWIAPSASIIQKTKIGDNVTVGLGSVVLKDVENETVVAGVPARKIEKK